MKDRFITLFGGLLALYIVIALLSPPSQPDYSSQPVTSDRDRHGLALLMEWLDNNTVPVHAMRQRYDDLYGMARIPDTGNLMVISLPLKIQPLEEEQEYLQQWIAEGNSVLLLVAHSDEPAWSANKSWQSLLIRYQLLAELGFSIQPLEDELEDTDTDASQLDTLNARLLQKGSLKAAGLNNPTINTLLVNQFPQQQKSWTLVPREPSRSSRVLLHETGNPDSGAMWQVRIGSGNAIISRYADLFSNNWLDEGDHARLFDSLLQQHLGKGGYVLFDDMHQGFTELYDAKAFFADPRLHNTLWFMFGFWLLYLIGRTNRLAPPLKIPGKAHAADFIRAMGGLFARRLSNGTTALGLIRHFFNEVRRQYGLPMNSQPVWALLEDAPRVPRQQLAGLQQAYTLAQQNKKQNLVKLHNQLRETRKSLL